MKQEKMNQLDKKIHEYLRKTSENLYVESEYLKIKWYCGWCESFIPVDDIEEKRYKTIPKSKSTLSMMQRDNFFICCLKFVDKFEKIKSLKLERE